MGFLWCRPGAAVPRCIVMSSPLMFSCSRSSQLCQFYFSCLPVSNHGVVAFSICLVLLRFFSNLLLNLCVLFLNVFYACVCVRVSVRAMLHGMLLFQSLTVDVSHIKSTENWIPIRFKVGYEIRCQVSLWDLAKSRYIIAALSFFTARTLTLYIPILLFQSSRTTYNVQQHYT